VARASGPPTSSANRPKDRFEKRGAVQRGSYCVNPFNDELVRYLRGGLRAHGLRHGAIMAVPAEDERDFAFAEAYGLPIVRTGRTARWLHGVPTRVTASRSTVGFLDGFDVPTAKRVASSSSSSSGIGLRQGQLPAARLAYQPAAILGLPGSRDVCPTHGIVPVPAESSRSFSRRCRVRPTSESPLRFRRGVPANTCPTCGGPALGRPTRWTPL